VLDDFEKGVTGRVPGDWRARFRGWRWTGAFDDISRLLQMLVERIQVAKQSDL